ncbi:MAG: stage II sporulation protein M [Nitrospiraceae bacterium]|nr:stage II sporulation protein M [Nitrospiraceae bacterium]
MLNGRFSYGPLGRHYADALRDLREARSAIIAAAIIFLCGALAGLAYPSLGEEGIAAIKGLAGQLAGQGLLPLIALIFIRNSVAASVTVVSGPLLGIIPFLGAAVNGLVFGAAISLIVRMHEATSLLKLFPHGLLELPAMVTAWGVGIRQAGWLFLRRKDQPLSRRRRGAYRVLLLIVIPLLFAAAVMEGTSIYIALREVK